MNLAFLAAVFSIASAEDKKPDVYVINTHIVIEAAYQDEHPQWGREIFDIIDEVNKQFANENLPVDLKVKDINTVSADFNKPKEVAFLELGQDAIIVPDRVTNALVYVHNQYYTQNYPENNEIVIVFIRQYRGRFPWWGMAYYASDLLPHVAVVARPQSADCNSSNQNCFPFLAHLTMHEVCHLFNARNLEKPESKQYLMYEKFSVDDKPTFKIDRFNRVKILQGLKHYSNE